MPFEYNINGKIIETDIELSEQEIDEIASSISSIPQDTADLSGAADFGFVPPTQSELEGTIAYRRGVQEGFTRLGEGLQQIGYGIGEKLGIVSPEEREQVNRQIEKERIEYLAQPLSETGWAKIGEIVGETAPLVLIPGGVQGGVVMRIATAGLAGGATAGVLPTSSGDLLDAERAQNVLIGTAGGAGTTAVLQTVPRVVKAGADFLKTPRGRVRQIVGQEDIDTGVQQIADEYGIQLTPGEASGLQEVLVSEEGLRTMTTEASRQLGKFIRGRMGKIDAKVNELLGSIITDEPIVAETILQGYKTLAATRLKPTTVDNLFSIKTIDKTTGKEVNLGPLGRRYFEKMKRDSGWATQLETVPKNSALEFDMFKRYLDEQQSKLTTAGRKQAARNIDSFKKEMVAGLDQLIPDYAATRSLASLAITRKSLQKELDSIPTKQKAISATGETIEVTDPISFFQRTMKKDSDFADLKRSLASSPKAVEKLENLRTLLSAIEKSPLQRQIAGLGDEVPSPAGGGAFGGAAGAAVFSGLDFFQKKRSEQMIEYITNENWNADLLKTVDPSALRKGSVEAYNQLVNILSRVSATTMTPEPAPQGQ